MMHTFEIIFILIIIGFQFASFLISRREIRKMKEIFPDQKGMGLVDVKFHKSKLGELDELGVSQRLYGCNEVEGVVDFTEYSGDMEPIELMDDSLEDISIPTRKKKKKEKKLQTKLIKVNSCSDTFRTISSETNSYLIQNSENAIDFNIIKDIAERKVEAQSNQVESTLHTPLYLGLLGTIAGIVIGLLYLTNSQDVDSELTDTLANQIPELLMGVSIAMTASFIGLFLTIVSTSYSYRKGLEVTDDKKNKYLTFIQSRLLSSVRDFSSNFKELSTKLSEINKEFSTDMNMSINSFTASIERLEDGIIQNQTKLLESIKDIDFKNIAKTFGNIDSSAEKLSGNINIQSAYIKRLYDSIELLKGQEEATKLASANIIDKMKKSYEDLNQYSTKEMEQLKQKYAELTPEFKQLNKLDELRGIKSQLDKGNMQSGKANDKMVSHASDAASSNRAILKELQLLNKNIVKLSNSRPIPVEKTGWWTRFKSLFRGKKKSKNNNQEKKKSKYAPPQKKRDIPPQKKN